MIWKRNTNHKKTKRRQLKMRKEYGGMGFRHLFGFNLAMLGKQGWKLQTEPDTIVTRIYKAKYFPRTDFLGARLGHNPSYIWRSIFASQVLVRGGQRWRVGNGRNINVWKDPWLRSEENSFISSPIINGLELEDLLSLDGITWNWQSINELINERDRAEIRKIMPSFQENEDKLIWKFNSKGHYTVKSAYRYAMESLVNNEEYRIPGDWMRMWKMQIPQKCKWLGICYCNGVQHVNSPE